MESDDLLLIKGIELEEPSRRADEAVLAFARRKIPTRARPVGRWTAWAHLSLAAGLLFALFILLPENHPPAKPGGTENETVRAPIEEILEIRAEIAQIGEMSELIPLEKQAEREAIAEKVKVCLASLEALEEKILRFDQSSLREVPRKEANI